MEPNQPSMPSQPVQPAPQSTPVWLIIILLLVFWPLAYYFMYKNKRYHAWFPILLWIFIFPFFLVAFALIFFVYPQTDTLYSSLNVANSNISLSYIILFSLIIFFIAEGIYAFIVWKKLRKQTASKGFLLSLVALLVFDWLVMGSVFLFAINSAVAPVQDLISQVGSSSLTPSPRFRKFTAAQYPLSFIYPSSWGEVHDKIVVPNHFMDNPPFYLRQYNEILIPTTQDANTNISDFVVSIYPNPKHLSIEQYITMLIPSSKLQGLFPLTISGFKGYASSPIPNGIYSYEAFVRYSRSNNTSDIVYEFYLGFPYQLAESHQQQEKIQMQNVSQLLSTIDFNN